MKIYLEVTSFHTCSEDADVAPKTGVMVDTELQSVQTVVEKLIAAGLKSIDGLPVEGLRPMTDEEIEAYREDN